MSQTHTGDTEKAGYTGSHGQVSTAATHRTHTKHKPGQPHPFLLLAWQRQEVWHSTHTATHSPSTSTAPLLPYTPDWILSRFIHPSFQALSGWCCWMLIANMQHSRRHPTIMGPLENQHTSSTQQPLTLDPSSTCSWMYQTWSLTANTCAYPVWWRCRHLLPAVSTRHMASGHWVLLQWLVLSSLPVSLTLLPPVALFLVTNLSCL